MSVTRRQVLALGAALPLARGGGAAEPDGDLGPAWARLFAGPPGETFAWWSHGTLFAHVDRLREFPVLGYQAATIARTAADGAARTLDFRTIGCFLDLDSGLPAQRWQNVFTGQDLPVPACFAEEPGRYTMTPARAAGGATLTLTEPRTRTNRVIATLESRQDRVILTQIEGTLQGFPGLDGALPALDDAAVTERQTRIQIIAPTGGPATRGYFSQVYDALPAWLGFGDALGSGLVKGQMRKAAADEVVDRTTWDHLARRVPDAFAGGRLVLR